MGTGRTWAATKPGGKIYTKLMTKYQNRFLESGPKNRPDPKVVGATKLASYIIDCVPTIHVVFI